eukprot:3224368-Prorocentrum_lima.AAC.1
MRRCSESSDPTGKVKDDFVVLVVRPATFVYARQFMVLEGQGKRCPSSSPSFGICVCRLPALP